MEEALALLAASLAVGIAALGTAVAQARIGAAGANALVEKPRLGGTILMLLAIPETIVILGFVIAALILLQR